MKEFTILTSSDIYQCISSFFFQYFSDIERKEKEEDVLERTQLNYGNIVMNVPPLP